MCVSVHLFVCLFVCFRLRCDRERQERLARERLAQRRARRGQAAAEEPDDPEPDKGKKSEARARSISDCSAFLSSLLFIICHYDWEPVDELRKPRCLYSNSGVWNEKSHSILWHGAIFQIKDLLYIL